MLERVGINEQGQSVYKGVYRFHETVGLPLDSIFECFARKDSVVSWIDFYLEALSAGMKHDRILSKLEEAISDVWGADFYCVVRDRLNLWLSLIQTRNEVMTLYRAIGGLEHHLIRQSENKEFPSRKKHQPIFYPVSSEDTAIKKAKDLNLKDKENGNIGLVVRFKVLKSYLTKYGMHDLDDQEHREYWIPCSDISKLNKNIIGDIETIHIFRPIVDNP